MNLPDMRNVYTFTREGAKAILVTRIVKNSKKIGYRAASMIAPIATAALGYGLAPEGYGLPLAAVASVAAYGAVKFAEHQANAQATEEVTEVVEEHVEEKSTSELATEITKDAAKAAVIDKTLAKENVDFALNHTTEAPKWVQKPVDLVLGDNHKQRNDSLKAASFSAILLGAGIALFESAKTAWAAYSAGMPLTAAALSGPLAIAASSALGFIVAAYGIWYYGNKIVSPEQAPSLGEGFVAQLAKDKLNQAINVSQTPTPKPEAQPEIRPAP